MPTVLPRKDHDIMADVRHLAQDVVERQMTMFASFVGQSLTTTYAALAAASGIPASTLQSYAGGTTMPVHVLLAISRHLPAAAIDLITGPAGKRLIDADKSDTNWDALAAKTSGLTFEICDARSDGQIDHVEDARLRATARALAAELTSVAEGKR
jgi:hypothetical protein